MILALCFMSPPSPLGFEYPYRVTQDLKGAIASRKPILVTGESPWPVSVNTAAWTPAGLSALVPDLGPVRIGNISSSPSGAHEFWNVDMALAAGENGFRRVQLTNNETSAATMPMNQFWESSGAKGDGAVHYYSGSLLEADGRASLPDLQRGLDELLAAVGRQQMPAARHFLKVWLGTDGASTPLHYDTQHNVYAQLHGTKDFWLLPPYAARQGDVRLYPRIHPLSHFVRATSGYSDVATSQTAFAVPEGPVSHCFGSGRDDFRGRCMLYVRLKAGDVFYLPPFWLHRTVCVGSSSTTTAASSSTASAASSSSASAAASPSASGCASTNVWVSSAAMQRMEDVEQMPLPFEAEWSLPTRLSAVLCFLRAMLRRVQTEETGEEKELKRRIAVSPPPPGGDPWFPPHTLSPAETVERLLSTRWHQAEDELLRPVDAEGLPSKAQQAVEAAECEPPTSLEKSESSGGGSDWSLVNLTKLDEYACRRAAAFAERDSPGSYDADRSWRSPKFLLLHDQLERIGHWATDGDARATLALLRRLRHCCEQLAAGASSGVSDEPAPGLEKREVDGHDEL